MVVRMGEEDDLERVGEETLACVNQRLLGLEKAFIHTDGLQGRPWHRSLFGGPDPFSGYSAWMLPGLRYEVETGSTEGLSEWEAVYVAAVEDLTQRLQSLVSLLTESTES